MDKELEKVFKGLTRSDLEVQYMLRNTRPGYEEKDIPRWLEQSELFRDKANGRLNLTYGLWPRNKLDFFAPKKGITCWSCSLHPWWLLATWRQISL